MPANLTPLYLKAEAAYRQASSLEEELECLQWMLREVPKHKGTDHLQAELKHKISRAKRDLAAQVAAGKKRHAVRISRQGAGRAILIGGPNCGKSQLLTTLTRATPLVAEYPFTTREPHVGMMTWQDVSIQMIDTPPITSDVMEPYLQGLIRGADVALLLLDLNSDEGCDQFADVLRRLDQTKTRLGTTSYLDETDLGLSYTQSLVVPTKMDAIDAAVRLELFCELDDRRWPVYPISAQDGTGLDALRDAIFAALDIIRVYTKDPRHKEIDWSDPFTLPRGGTVADVAALVHADLAARLKFAKVWASGSAASSVVNATHVLSDRDIIELHTS